MGSGGIDQLVHQYGLALVFAATGLQAVGTPVPGTTVLVAAAVYAATARGLPIAGVIAAGAIGAFAGTTAGFALGRWGGAKLLERIGGRLRQSPERVEHLRAAFAARASVWLVIGRFITGVRNIIGLIAGTSGMPLARFLPVSALAATLWASISALEYYWFGHAVAAAGTWLQAVLIGAGVAWTVLVFSVLRRRALRRMQATPSAPEIG